MTPKNTICLWFDEDAHEAARFYGAASVLRGDDDHAEDRRRHHRGSAAGLTGYDGGW